jgi:O-antigen/teichoic acid export membrane protein
VAGVLLTAVDATSPLKVLLVASVVGLAISPMNAMYVVVAIGAIRSLALVRTIGALVSTLIAVMFIRTKEDTVALALLLVVPGIVNALGSTMTILRHEPPRHRLKDGASMPATPGAWYRRGFDYAKADVSLLIYMSIDRLLLFATAGALAVGLYEAAFRLIQPFYALSTVIRESMFLELARSIGGDRLAPTLKRWARLMLVATIPVGPFLSLHGAWVVGLVYGPGFAAAALPLAILGWAITIGFVSGAVVLPFLSWNLGREYGNAVLAGNVTNVAGNLILTPPLGATGAALATVAAKVAVTVVGLGPFRATTTFPIIGWSMRYLAASVVSAIASVAAWAGSTHEPISILAFGLAYAASVVLMEWSDTRLSRTLRSQP